MKKLMLAALAAIGLSGCVGYDGYGTGISIGYGGSYGTTVYGGYGGYGGDRCITYDRYGRAYYSCGYGGYGYSPQTVIYYYPGYTYRGGYYYDRYNRPYDGRLLYRRYYGTRGY